MSKLQKRIFYVSIVFLLCICCSIVTYNTVTYMYSHNDKSIVDTEALMYNTSLEYKGSTYTLDTIATVLSDDFTLVTLTKSFSDGTVTSYDALVYFSDMCSKPEVQKGNDILRVRLPRGGNINE